MQHKGLHGFILPSDLVSARFHPAQFGFNLDVQMRRPTVLLRKPLTDMLCKVYTDTDHISVTILGQRISGIQFVPVKQIFSSPKGKPSKAHRISGSM